MRPVVFSIRSLAVVVTASTLSLVSLATSAVAQIQQKPVTLYVVLCVDTESRRLSSRQRVQHLDLSDFAAGGPVDSAMTDDFRNAFTDSFGGHPKFSWFALTHPAFAVADPPQPLAIFNALAPYQSRMTRLGDIVGWHYHHSLWPNADSNCCWDQITSLDGTRYGELTDIEAADQMLALLILRARIYPSLFRAGFVWENNDFSNWLEQVIPFDFSNTAPLKTRAVDSVERYVGAAYDWSRAPQDWSFYHPGDSDYQTPGNMKRVMFRCIPGHRSADINFGRAFGRALGGTDVVVGLYTHSFNNLNQFCNVTASALRNASTLYPSVKYKFVNALEGARAVLGYTDTVPPVLTLEARGGMLTVSSNEPLFAPPVGAYTDSLGRIHRAYPISRVGQKGKSRFWEWQFDPTIIRFTEFSAGACDSSGNGAVTVILKP